MAVMVRAARRYMHSAIVSLGLRDRRAMVRRLALTTSAGGEGERFGSSGAGAVGLAWFSSERRLLLRLAIAFCDHRLLQSPIEGLRLPQRRWWIISPRLILLTMRLTIHLAVVALCAAFAPSSRRLVVRRAVAADDGLAIGLEVGTRVRVTASDIKLWHHPKFKAGLNPNGCEGVVKRIATVARDGTAISANRPYCVMLDNPKLLAHFEATEIEAIA